MSNNIKTYTFDVPSGMGHLLGNTIRQFAMRGVATWQPAAYRIGTKVGTMGAKEDTPYSTLMVLKGKAEGTPNKSDGSAILTSFVRQDKMYVERGGSMRILNLDNLGPEIEVCLVKASGSRTAAQNYSTVEDLVKSNESSGKLVDFVAVPSKHIPSISFAYTIEHHTETVDSLSITSEDGCVLSSIDEAIEQLTALKKVISK